MTALPPNTFANVSHHSSYNICLNLEQRYQDAPAPTSGPSKLICARILGYLLLEAPTITGRDTVSSEVTFCINDQELFDLAKLYIYRCIGCFKSAKGTTPPLSDHSSRQSFDEAQVTTKYALQEGPKNHRDGKDAALVRDGYRCVLTGKCDSNHLYNPRIQAAVALGAYLTVTKSIHILLGSTNSRILGVNKGSAEHEDAAGAWAGLDRFAGISITKELNGPEVHRLENIMTLSVSFCEWFETLWIWFEATDIANEYRPKAIHPAFLRDFPETVRFTSTNPAVLPLPSPHYLRLHAACARVAHLSGAGEYVDTVIGDLEKISVLAADGSSADILSYALSTTSSNQIRQDC